MEIIPAIDIIGGQVVRLSKGDYDTKRVYSNDPLEVAKQYEAAGIKRLHLVDLDGAKGSGIVNLGTLERLAGKTTLVIDFGGGIKDTSDLESAFNAGASLVTCGSVAVKKPELVSAWIKRFSSDRLILGADVKAGLVHVSGWLEASRVAVGPFIDSYMKQGLANVICTDIERDGMFSGPSLELYQALLASYPGLRLIASGGIASIEDLRSLRRAGLHGAIIGKALLEGRITLQELRLVEEEEDAGQANLTMS